MNQILRVLDANLNRSREGIRVCEDLARLVMNDVTLSKSLKKIRHDINIAAMNIPYLDKEIVAARDSVRDVGKNEIIRDQKNMSWKSLMKSNLKRAEESLRALEECSKIVSPRTIHAFQKIRFCVYELEKKIVKQL